MKAFSMVLLVLLAGCASFTPKPIDPAAQQMAYESRRLDGPEVRQFIERSVGHEIAPWPPKSWDITTLTLAAMHFHPDLENAQAATLLAQARILTAGARPNPTLSATLQNNASTPAGQSPWTYGLGLDIPIETAGKRDYRLDQARHLAQAAKLREADTVWQVRSRLRTSLLAAYPTEAQLVRQRDLQEEIARLLQQRFAAGYASQPDLTQARLTLDQATLALAENRKQRAENLARLASAVGVPMRALDGREIGFDVFEQLVPPAELPSADLQRQALLTRPDVRAALAEYAASQSALQLEVARQYPDISLGPGFSWDQGASTWSLGLSLVLPLLNRNEGPIAEAKAQRQVAAAAFLSTQAKAIAEVDQARAGYGQAVRKFEIADRLLREQQKQERVATAALRAGEADRLTWLSARYETASAELARINALIEAQQSLGLLQDALRRPIGEAALPAADAAVTQPIHNGAQP